MPIKFPTLHIAQSVINRILNAADELARPSEIEAPAPAPAPAAPDPTLQGAQLDAALATPAPEMPPAEMTEPADAGSVAGGIARGGNALGGLLQGARGGDVL